MRSRGWAIAVVLALGAVVPAATSAAGAPTTAPLRVFPVDPSDKSIKLGLLPYHALAPELNSLQQNNRIKVKVIGQSLRHRDIYQVTVTAPETAAEEREQDLWRAEIENNPMAAAKDEALQAGYKAPIWINSNIHGDEWEGTDAAMRTIRRLAAATDPHTLDLLARTRIVFNLTANPDGRVAGTRENAAGYDLNRDYLTSSQPENRAARDSDIHTQPVYALDLHGYIEGTLIEPSNPPHGQNYEYDLTIKPMYDNAIAIEKAVEALGHPEAQHTQIPFRDYPDSWDDWSPNLTTAYAPLHGSAAITVELPAPVDDQYYNTVPVEELRHRSEVNVDVADTTIQTTMDYVLAHRTDLISAQIETFRRGIAGEPQRTVPDGFVPGFGPEDRSSTEFPRAYVIAGKSDPATARLVNHLIAHDIRVTQANGSYVVDMHQPKRGLANTMLEPGADLTGRTDGLTDTAAWSLSYLWGADVSVLKDGPVPAGHPVTSVKPVGGIDGYGTDLALTLQDGNDIEAVNSLLAKGVPLRRQNDGTIVVPRQAAQEIVTRYAVRLTAAHGPSTPLRRPAIAADLPDDQISLLRDLGFTVQPVTTADLKGGFDLSTVDLFMVGNSLRYDLLDPAIQAKVKAFTGGLILTGYAGIQFNEAASVLPVTSDGARSAASGIISVTNTPTRLGGQAPQYTFVSGPYGFSGLGPDVQVEQRYGAGNPLIAGFWPARKDGHGLVGDFANQPSIVSATSANGNRVVMFGTNPLFRAQSKALFAQAANAIYWSASRD